MKSPQVTLEGAEILGCLVAMVLLILAFMVFGFFLGGAVVYLAWNHGVAAVADVPRVSFVAAGCLSLALGVVRSTLSRGGSK